jgi:nitrogen-specific signal transduction histidine kinase
VNLREISVAEMRAVHNRTQHNGPGIPSTVQDSVFQPFVSYGKAEGNGLGLAIAKRIVEDHGGMIRG